MKKRLLTIVIPGFGLILLALIALNSYKLELVHKITLNATLQKAPDSYPRDRIENAFLKAWSRSSEQSNTSHYLSKLLELSARLEKVQLLSAQQIEAIIATLPKDASRDAGSN
jgi:hypothetical protein